MHLATDAGSNQFRIEVNDRLRITFDPDCELPSHTSGYHGRGIRLWIGSCRDPEGTNMSGFRMGSNPNIRFAIGSDTNISEDYHDNTQGMEGN